MNHMSTTEDLSTRVIDGWDHIDPIRDVWNSLVLRHSERIDEFDVTATYEWARTLWAVFGTGKRAQFITLTAGGEVAALLPLYRGAQRIHKVPCRRISPITELYSGRCGFLLREHNAAYVEGLLDALWRRSRKWDVFIFTVVAGSASETLWLETARRRGYRFETLSTQASPYIMLDKSWPDYVSSLPKQFRTNLRQGQRKLSAAGHLTYRQYEKDSDLGTFLQAVVEIERASWKEAAGTSITTNDVQQRLYEDLIHVAARRGWFSGHVLELNGEPIAYVYGLAFNGTFCDLKESYKQSYKAFSPGQVLKTFVLEQLIARNVRLYDYMGLCEPYKMRWTDRTYRRTTYMLYNRTSRALAARLCGHLIAWLGHRGWLGAERNAAPGPELVPLNTPPSDPR